MPAAQRQPHAPSTAQAASSAAQMATASRERAIAGVGARSCGCGAGSARGHWAAGNRPIRTRALVGAVHKGVEVLGAAPFKPPGQLAAGSDCQPAFSNAASFWRRPVLIAVLVCLGPCAWWPAVLLAGDAGMEQPRRPRACVIDAAACCPCAAPTAIVRLLVRDSRRRHHPRPTPAHPPPRCYSRAVCLPPAWRRHTCTHIRFVTRLPRSGLCSALLQLSSLATQQTST